MKVPAKKLGFCFISVFGATSPFLPILGTSRVMTATDFSVSMTSPNPARTGSVSFMLFAVS